MQITFLLQQREMCIFSSFSSLKNSWYNWTIDVVAYAIGVIAHANKELFSQL